jgi:thiosulfate reductase/polysulfide reductase chain A
MKKAGGGLSGNQFVLVEFQDQLTAVNTFIRFSKIVKDSLEWKKIYGVLIHPDRARELGIKTGDMVRIRGPNGELVAKAIVSSDVHPYILAAPHATGVDASVVPLKFTVQGANGAYKVKLFSNGGGYGVNNNFLADPYESIVPEEGYHAAQHDFIVTVEKA